MEMVGIGIVFAALAGQIVYKYSRKRAAKSLPTAPVAMAAADESDTDVSSEKATKSLLQRK